MKFYVSSGTKGIKRVVALSKDTGKGSPKAADTAVGRRISNRTVVLLGVVVLLAFVRVAVLVLESSALCSSSLGNFSDLFLSTFRSYKFSLYSFIYLI